MAINFHYCGGYLAHIAILNFGDHIGCPCNPKDMPKDCCKDKLLSFKTDKHKTAQRTAIANAATFSTHLPVQTINTNPVYHFDGYDTTHSPSQLKRSSPQPTYLLINVFRI